MSYGAMTVSDESGTIWEKVKMACFKALFLHLSRGTEETHKISIRIADARLGFEPGKITREVLAVSIDKEMLVSGCIFVSGIQYMLK
jgi:hypothetical protein